MEGEKKKRDRREYMRRYYQENIVRIKIKRMEWWDRQTEETLQRYREANRAWCKDHPERCREVRRRYIERKKADGTWKWMQYRYNQRRKMVRLEAAKASERSSCTTPDPKEP